MDDRYIVVQLVDGQRLDFDRKCNSVNYSNSKYCIFKQDMGDNYYNLAIIPHDSIKAILFEDNRKENL